MPRRWQRKCRGKWTALIVHKRWGRGDEREAVKGNKNRKTKQKQRLVLNDKQLIETVRLLFQEEPLDGNVCLRRADKSLALFPHVNSAGCAFVPTCLRSRLQNALITCCFSSSFFFFNSFSSDCMQDKHEQDLTLSISDHWEAQLCTKVTDR